MIYTPSKGSMWDPSIIWHEGTYHLFSMQSKWMWHAVSPDGVHWSDAGPAVHDPDGMTVFKGFVARCGDRFIMNYGSFDDFFSEDGELNPARRQNRLRFFESTDLETWRHLFDSHPDVRWYREEGRWDDMYILPKREGDPSAGYWGYPTATPKDDVGYPAFFGLLQSRDGTDWEAVAPPPVEWGGVPPRHLESGGCERISERYYFLAGGGGYLGNWCYSMFTFVADQPTGPFRPDVEAFRLSGNTGLDNIRGVHWLAAFARGENEILVSNYLMAEEHGSWSMIPAINKPVWLLPLRKAVVDAEGHLRLGYWPNNDAAKEASLDLRIHKSRTVAVAPAAADDLRYRLNQAVDEVELSTEADQRGREFRNRSIVALFGGSIDAERGAIIEGELRAEPKHGLPCYAGFCLEEGEGRGTAVLLEVGHCTWRRSRIGRLQLSDGFDFTSLDETGPGCATVTGLDPGRPHRFRLWIRKHMFELYIDDILMQTFVTDGPPTGRLGLIVQNGTASFTSLQAWTMDLGD